MKIGALIQARMGSTRLPGKVLMDLKGKPVLWHIAQRLKRSAYIDEIVILTTVEEKDDVIEAFCIENDIKVFRGSEKNVLERFYLGAKKFHITDILRITADCPLIDPQIIDVLIEKYKNENYDFYGVGKGFPNGINGAIFSFEAIEESYRMAKKQDEIEHVGEYIKNNRDKFFVGFYDNKISDKGHYRVTLDTEDDYILIKEIYNSMYDSNEIILLKDIYEYFENEGR